MEINVRDRLHTLAVRAGDASTWTSLASIGESPLVRLTILVPFIGYFILYNDYALSFFSSSFEYLRGGGIEQQAPSSALHRLNMLYFGLTALGIASFAYTVSAPRELVRHRTEGDYLQYMSVISTPAMLRRSIYKTIDGYGLNAHSTEGMSLAKLGFPDRLRTAIWDLIRDASGLAKPARGFNPTISETGYPVYDDLFEILYFRNAATKLAVGEFEHVLHYVEKDVWQLEYIRKNHSVPMVRLLVLGFYIVGFALLFYPSVDLTVRLLVRLF